MPKNIFFKITGLTALFFISLAAGWYFMPRVDPQFAGLPHITRAEARKIVDEFLQQQQYNTHDFYVDSFYARDYSGLDYLTRTKGFEYSKELANSDEVPLAYWQFHFYRNVPRNAQAENFLVRISPYGKIIGYTHFLPDSVTGSALSAEEAESLALGYMKKWSRLQPENFSLQKSILIEKPGRTDYKLLYSRTDKKWAEAEEMLEIRIAGEKIEGFMRSFKEPETFIAASGVVGAANILFNSLSVATFVLIIILSLTVFLRGYHQGLLGVRTALFASGLFYLLLLLEVANSWSYFGTGTSIGQISDLYKKFIVLGMQLVTAYLFLFLNVFSSWSAGNHEIREQKPRLLSGLDSVLRRRWFSKNFSREVLPGFVFGTALFALSQIVNFVLISAFGARPRTGFESGSIFSSQIPLLGAIITILAAVLYREVVFRKFLIPYLRRVLRSTAGAILLSALAYALFSIFFNPSYSFWPSYYTLVPYFIFALFQGILFWRYGILAAMSSSAIFSGLELIIPLFETQNPSYVFTGAALIALFAGIAIVALVGALRGKFYELTLEEEPAHIRRIKERTRMQKELEIARRVQLGLLPKDNPQLAGFDISGISIPAQEVGGDYFDFIHLQNGNLGIAIGDVSGKGVPAAIYMTLTKGILQSHAESELSPKQVLAKVNNLMYRTIERSWYVSMFYAVLDARQKKLRFSRAGHNPAIVFHRGQHEPELLQPAGIGLGLEIGDIFAKTLVEAELQLLSGTTLVFYTDGLTEAMNSQGEEFGEDRFLDILRQRNNGSSEKLVHDVLAEIRNFAGDAPQHDDMTMVVLKVY